MTRGLSQNLKYSRGTVVAAVEWECLKGCPPSIIKALKLIYSYARVKILHVTIWIRKSSAH